MGLTPNLSQVSFLLVLLRFDEIFLLVLDSTYAGCRVPAEAYVPNRQD